MIIRGQDYERVAPFRVHDVDAIEVTLRHPESYGEDLKIRIYSGGRPDTHFPQWQSDIGLLKTELCYAYLRELNQAGLLRDDTLSHLCEYLDYTGSELWGYQEGILIRLRSDDERYPLTIFCDYDRIDLPAFCTVTSNGNPLSFPYVLQSRFSHHAGWNSWKTGEGRVSSLISDVCDMPTPF